jgi:hypothetical protein
MSGIVFTSIFRPDILGGSVNVVNVSVLLLNVWTASNKQTLPDNEMSGIVFTSIFRPDILGGSINVVICAVNAVNVFVPTHVLF